MSTINNVSAASYTPLVSTPSTTPSTSTTDSTTGLSQQDTFELSLAGRIALNVQSGRLSTDQGQQLYTQLDTINQQIQSGASGVGQLQNQLSEQIYGDTHNGASIPADSTLSPGLARDFEEAGRVVGNESAGNLTSSQGSQFLSQIGQIYEQSQNGASASATNQAQNQLSVEIYDAAHGITGTPTAS